MVVSQTHWNVGNPFIIPEALFTLDANWYLTITTEMSYERISLHLFDMLPALARIRAPDILGAAE